MSVVIYHETQQKVSALCLGAVDARYPLAKHFDLKLIPYHLRNLLVGMAKYSEHLHNTLR